MKEIEKFNDLVGETIIKFDGEKGGDQIFIHLKCGGYCTLNHSQDCCENVLVEDIVGDTDDLLDVPLLMAEEVASEGETPTGLQEPADSDDSFTWTFYKLGTIHGSITIRWYGSSNGYYSEDVSFAYFPIDHS